MKIYKKFNLPLKIIPPVIISIVLIIACAGTTSQVRTNIYYFEYEGEKYAIRSIDSRQVHVSRNELISDKLLAVDLDQNRFIDDVSTGDMSINQAQIIYEYGLQQLQRENKLKIVQPEPIYYHYENTEYTYEIRSFDTVNRDTFNQFRLYEKNQLIYQPLIICNDVGADGNLDLIIKGTANLADIQSTYENMIKHGLENHTIAQRGNKFIVLADK